MTLSNILYTILIGPLQLIFEVIFSIANRYIGHPGLAIMVLSLIMNFLVLPLYKRADAMQEETRDTEEKLQKGVIHIKKTFSGDERMMILQTYYQQNNYKPTDALNGSVSLLLEVPFFIAAYQFLSHLELLQGVSLGPIADLASPDALLNIAGISVNILPIIMTLINLISSAIYLKGFPVKTKIQLYAMALFFLVFLYTSPSGLVFYWTLNNLFSLGKNIFYKLKNPRKVLNVMFSFLGIMILGYSILSRGDTRLKEKVVLVGIGMAFQLPMIMKVIKNIFNVNLGKTEKIYDKKIFLMCGLFLAVFIGIWIPSTVIVDSPLEFINIKSFYNPLWYIVSSGCFAIGLFLIWMSVFYWIANNNGRYYFNKIIWCVCATVVVNYMFFGTDLGIIFANLQFENGIDYGFRDEIVNFIVLFIVILFMYLIFSKIKPFVGTILLTMMIAIICMSGTNILKIYEEVSTLEIQNNDEIPSFNLSKNGKNIIVFMLDRAINQYIPYIFNEKPELKAQYAGFTYYSNVLSHGGATNFTTPELFGGYEYTPVEINKRSFESLEEKQNEALKVMPAIYAENDYEVTVCDPPYAGYKWIPDLSIYDDIPGVKTYITRGEFDDTTATKIEIKNNSRNFFCYGIMKVMPLFMQELLYDNGSYNQADGENSSLYVKQIRTSNTTAEGMNSNFMSEYNILINLPKMTKIVENEVNTFMMIVNNITHEPMLLQEPEYEPVLYTDNTEYDNEHKDRFFLNGRKMRMETEDQIIHYQTNMAALIKLGEWFDYMRDNDVYDNTRIILVADHGNGLRHFEELILGEGNEPFRNVEFFYPLLMIKDFNSKEFEMSDEFMTNADVPFLAMKDLIEEPINPYTGKRITNNQKEGPQYIISSNDWNIEHNNGNTFSPAKWYKFEGDSIWDKESWTYFDEELILPIGVE